MIKWGTPRHLAWVKAVILSAGLAVAAEASPARAETAIQILSVDPSSPAEIGQSGDFALRIGFSSTQPVIISAEPLYEGCAVPAINGGQAHVEAGQGEILLWFSYSKPQRIDAVTVIARSAAGKFVTQTNLPVELAWTGRPAPRRERAEWVQRLKEEGQKQRKAQAEASYNSPMMQLMDLLAEAMMLAVPGYFMLQIVLLWRLRGSWRKAAAAPLLPMGVVIAYVVYALLDGSNIAPVVLVLTAPLALIYLAIIAWLSGMRNRPAVSA
jgi:hypothetical protein